MNKPEANRLYHDLSDLWPLVSPPELYAAEARIWRSILRERLGPGRHALLELGVGGGHNLSHFAGGFQVTAVDISERMLEHSRRLNPGVEHLQGDMRSLRLGRKYAAVLIHDAICYMLDETELSAAFETAAAHLDQGGLLLTAPDYTRETFQDSAVWHTSRRNGPLELTYLEYVYDADPTDTMYQTLMFFIVREGGGAPRVEQDLHSMGLFPRRTWFELLRRAGFKVDSQTRTLSDGECRSQLFVAIKR